MWGIQALVVPHCQKVSREYRMSFECSQPLEAELENRVEYVQVTSCGEDTLQSGRQAVLIEEPLLIEIEGRPYSVVMRTPGEEIVHAAGFCLAEGFVERIEDFASISYCDQSDSNVVTVTLQPDRRKKVSPLLERGAFLSQTSCGICGKKMLKDLDQILKPIESDIRISVDQVMACVRQLLSRQLLFRQTRSSHATMLFDARLNLLAVAEDVGRHNALDKAIGKVFLNRGLADLRLGILSSRMSYEMVQKAGRAHLPILLSLSRPTSLAIELGLKLNMSLACALNETRISIYCGGERLQHK